MRLVLLINGATLLAAAACDRRPGVNVLDQDTTGQVLATTECTVKNPNGTCNVKTCKEDAKSNCLQFANACMDTGHHYSGTKEGGTCTRVL